MTPRKEESNVLPRDITMERSQSKDLWAAVIFAISTTIGLHSWVRKARPELYNVVK
jgi:hypothetical protein